MRLLTTQEQEKELIWHFNDCKDNDDPLLFWKKKGLYIEWKYFNGYSNDLKFLIAYAYPDPDRELKLWAPEVYIRIQRPNKEVVYIPQSFPDTPIDYDTKNSIDIKYDDYNFVDQLDDKGNEIRIRGELKNVSWDLTYKRDNLDLVHEFKNMDLSFEVLGQKVLSGSMDWQIIMPRAKVTGYLKLGDQKYDIDLISDFRGYSDSNWGKWNPVQNDCMWNWGQCSGVTPDEKTYALLIGELFNQANEGQVYVEMKNKDEEHNKRFIFDKSKIKQYKIEADDWFPDTQTGIDIPMRHKINLDNGEHSLEVFANTLYYDIFPIKVPHATALNIPISLKDFYVIQMHVTYEGHLYENGQKILDINTQGFMEHTGTTSEIDLINRLKAFFSN